MKALVVEKNHLHLRELPFNPPGDNDASVRVRAAGICATDLHILSGRIKFDEARPRVLGHEIAGTVEHVGKDVSADWIGKNVIVDPVIGCGFCRLCRSGRKLLCRSGGELGTTGGNGGYAEYVNLPATNLYSLPGSLSFDEGAIVEPLNCTYGAFVKALPRPGDSVLVFGEGPAGLLFVQLARAFGCKPIFIVGGSALRLKLSDRLGADEALSYRDAGLVDRVLNATDGEGPDIAIEASGADAAVRHAFDLVRPGGRIVLYGIGGARNVNIASDLVVAKDLSVVAGIGSPLLWDEVICLAASGIIDLNALITHRFGLDECDRAIAVATDPEQSVKVVFCLT